MSPLFVYNAGKFFRNLLLGECTYGVTGKSTFDYDTFF